MYYYLIKEGGDNFAIILPYEVTEKHRYCEEDHHLLQRDKSNINTYHLRTIKKNITLKEIII